MGTGYVSGKDAFGGSEEVLQKRQKIESRYMGSKNTKIANCVPQKK